MRMQFFSIAIMVILASCVSLEDSGRAYFRQGNKVKGVEPAEALLARMKSEQKLRDIMYGQVKSVKVVQCTLLRNQLYVAAMKSPNNKEIVDAVRELENAYQENDATFLSACDRVMSMHIGQVFMAIQNDYLARREKE